MSKNLTLTLKIDANGNLVSVMDQASQKVKTFGKSVDDAGNASDKLSNRLTDMAHIAATVFSVTQVYQFHAALLQTTAQLESMGKAYGAIFGKNEGVQQMQFITSVADQMGLKFADAAQQFKGFAAATAGTALAGAHTQSIFLATASAAATLGLSTEQSGRAFLAMSQMAGKGVVSMEELRGQLAEAIPGAVGLAANAMGVTIAELNKMVESGTVLSSDLLPKLADELQKMYGASANGASNVTAELNRLDNATTALGAAYTSGWADDATVIIRDMTTFFTDPSVIAGAKSLGESVGTLMRTISDNKEAVLTVTGALIGLLRAGGVGAIVGGIGGFSLSQIINDTDVQRIKSLKAELADLKPNAFNWQSVSWRRKQLEDEIAYLEDWAEVSKSTYKVVYDTAAKAEADKSAAALSEAKKRATIAGQEFDEWSKGIDALNKYDFEQRKKSLADWEAGERKKASLAQQASKEILQAKKRAQDEAYDHFEKNLQAQEKAQQDYQKSVSDTFDSVRRELDPTIDLYEAYNKKVQAVTASTLAGSADQEAMLKKLQENLNKQLDELRNKNEGTADAVRVAWEQSIKRLDDAFANVWEDIFSGASDFGSSLKRWFTSLLAELAHAAITKPIVISMSGAMGIGGASSALASSGGAGGAFDIIGNIGSMYSGVTSMIGAGATYLGSMAAGAGSAQAAMLASQSAAFGLEGAALTTGALTGGTAATSVLSTMASAAPYVAAILAIDALTGGSISTGVFGGARGERTRALNIGISNGQVSDDSNIYRATHYDAGWGRSGSWNVDNLGGTEFNQIIKDTVNSMAVSIRDNAERLGFEFNEGFSGQFDADLFGKTAEETQQIIADTFVRIGQSMVDSVAASGEKTVEVTKTITESVISTYDDYGNAVYELVDRQVTELATVSNTLSDILAPLQKSGEQTYETLARVVGQFDAFNYPVGRLNDSLATLSISTLSAVDSLVSMAGSMTNLQALQSGFVNAFYTDAQKAELTTQSVTRLFDAIGLSAPASREALVGLVQGLDLTTEAGQRAYLAITGATATLDQFYSVLERQPMTNITNSQVSIDYKQLVNDAFSSLKESVQVELDAVSKTYNARVSALSLETDAIKKNISALSTMRTALQSTYDTITASTSNPLIRYTSGQSTLQSILSSYRLGIAPVQSDIDRALRDVSVNDQAYYASFEDYSRDQAITSGIIAQIMALTDDSLSIEDRTLAAIDAQLNELKRQYDLDVSALNQTLDSYQQQVNAINGVNTSVLSVQEAIASLASAISGAMSASRAATAGSNIPSYAYDAYSVEDSPEVRQAKVEAQTGQVVSASDSAQLAAAKVLYQSVTGGANTAQYNAALDAIGGSFSNIGWDGSREGAAALVLKYGGSLPAFASGGDHLGGIRLVGENGPELEVTGPSRIFNAQQTHNILRGTNSDNSDALIAEIKALRAEVSALRDENKQLASSTLNESRKQARVLEKWDADGLPQAVAV